MTDHKDMPKEIWVYSVPFDNNRMMSFIEPIGVECEKAKYTRLTPKIEDADLEAAIAYAREYIVDSRVNYLSPHHVETLIRAASQPVQEVTVEDEVLDDAIVEVLKEMRDPEVGNRVLARAIRRAIRIVKPAQRGEGE